MFWFVGFIAFIAYRVFNAGMKSETLFYTKKEVYSLDYRKKDWANVFDGEKLFNYCVVTLGFAVTWPLSFPAAGIFLLGKRYAK